MFQGTNSLENEYSWYPFYLSPLYLGRDCVPARGHTHGARMRARSHERTACPHTGTVSMPACGYVNRTRIRATYGATYRMWFRLPVPKTNPDPNPNPRTHPNPNPIFNRNRNKVFERKQKRHPNIVIFPGFLQGRGGGKEGPVSPTAKRGPADDLNVWHAIY